MSNKQGVGIKLAGASGTKARAKKLQAPQAEDRGRQVIRLIDLLRTLENARRGLTVKQLMDQASRDCSERTLYRDLDHLKQAGFQVIEEEGRYRVVGPSIAAEALKPSQLLSLLIAGECIAPWRGLSIEADFRSLVASLHARLTPEGRAWVESSRNNVAVTYRAAHLQLDQGSLEAMEEALSVEQCLKISYANPGQEARERIVEPHLLWQHGEQPYLVAYCRAAADWRHFALARIKSAELLDEVFEPRSDFDASEYVRRGFGVFHGRQHRIVLRFSSEVAHLPSERCFHPTQELAECADGAVELTMTAGGLPEIATWLAGFGGKVVVLDPQELRDLVRKIHTDGLKACALP